MLSHVLCLSFLCFCFVFLKVIFALNLENRGIQHQGSDKPRKHGKHGKTAVFEGTQGKPGKLR